MYWSITLPFVNMYNADKLSIWDIATLFFTILIKYVIFMLYYYVILLAWYFTMKNIGNFHNMKTPKYKHRAYHKTKPIL